MLQWKLKWADLIRLQNLLLIPCHARKIHTLIMKFKINLAVSFVHAPLAPLRQISFSNSPNDVCFRLSCVHSALGLLSFTNASEALKGYTASSVYTAWSQRQDLQFTWTSFLRRRDWKLAWQTNYKMATFPQTVWYKHCWAMYGSYLLRHFRTVLC